MLAKGKPETGIKLYLESALTVDKLASKKTDDSSLSTIVQEFISQSFGLYEEHSADSTIQSRCIVAMIGTLLACRSLGKSEYEGLIMKTAQYSAKIAKKPEQCAMVMQCSQLFYVIGEGDEIVYSNDQRGLECLQRALKLADACTNSNPTNVQLFVDLLDQYLFFFEKKHPLITGAYINGLVALIKEHCDKLGPYGGAVGVSKTHFLRIVHYIKSMKEKTEFSARFAEIDVSSVST